MRDWTRSRRITVPIVVIVLLVATTMGMAWHHHSHSSADQCMLCHLVIAPAPAGASVCGTVAIVADHAVPSYEYVSRWVSDQTPPRAPPV